MERGNGFLKRLDRWLGPALLRLARVYRRLRPKRSPGPREALELAAAKPRVALLKLAGIGDLVLLSAVIDDLKAQIPNLHLTLFTGAGNAPFARLLRNIDDLRILPVSRPDRALREIRREPFDVLLNCDSWARLSALLGSLSRAHWVIGFFTPGQARHFADDVLVEHRRDRHEIENLRALLEPLKLIAKSPPQKIPAPALSLPPEEFAVFHLWPAGTKSWLREWPERNWIRLAQELLQSGLSRIYLTGGPSDQPRTDAFLGLLPPEISSRVQSFAGRRLEETAGLLSRASLVVSVDTGIMHLAAALEVPVVSLHGPSTPKRWGGVGPRVYPAMSTSPGAGHLHLGFEYGDETNRMEGISVDQVLAICQTARGDRTATKDGVNP